MHILIAGAVLIFLAMALAAFEITMYKRRHRFEGHVFRYSKKRFIRRMTTAGLIVAVALMILGGVQNAYYLSDPKTFNLYWLFLFLLVIAIAVLPILDFWETYKNYHENYRSLLEEYASLFNNIDKKRQNRRS